MGHDDILKAIEAGGHGRVKYAIADIDGVLRAKVISREKFRSAMSNDVAFCDVLFGWDVADTCYDNSRFAGWHTGYPDHKASIDPATFRTVPWDDGLPYFLADFSRDANVPCPRAQLRKIAAKCEELGFRPEFAHEFEWYNFAGTPRSIDAADYINLTPITPGMFGYSQLRPAQFRDYCNELFDLLNRFGIPVETFHTETGPGVYEASIAHAPIVEAADRAVLFKAAVKEIASRHGIVASFMAKWDGNLPGSGGHIHQSLLSLDGKRNLFNMAEPELLESYLAGLLTCLPDILPMYAPTINSYKRLRNGAWAPTSVTWGMDNRTAAVRLINGDDGTRLEMRVPGADCNPYIAMAACLASGIYGIKHKLKLSEPASIGNAYAQKGAVKLPDNLQDATRAMKKSTIPEGIFDRFFLDHFIASREWECKEYNKAVTNWELKRYLEII
ncbi:MAG: glutamine synthetase family protein [Bacteroidales bacterium]|jgi:glutamine synthetase|nr:glutamine synthetase family protein [Bacteroidales bacterium]